MVTVIDVAETRAQAVTVFPLYPFDMIVLANVGGSAVDPFARWVRTCTSMYGTAGSEPRQWLSPLSGIAQPLLVANLSQLPQTSASAVRPAFSTVALLLTYVCASARWVVNPLVVAQLPVAHALPTAYAAESAAVCSRSRAS